MKTETNSTNSSSNEWPSNDELPHLNHEDLPVIGSCQVSSILSNLEDNKVSSQNPEVSQNMELIMLQKEDMLDNLDTADFVIVNDPESSSCSRSSMQSVNANLFNYTALKIPQPDMSAENVNNCNTKHKQNNEFPFIFCALCPFFSLTDSVMAMHIGNSHKNGMGVKLNKLRCPGCTNTFYHRLSFTSHLIYDHGIGSTELFEILQLVVSEEKREKEKLKALVENFVEFKTLHDENDEKQNDCDVEQRKENMVISNVETNSGTSTTSVATIRVLSLTELEPQKELIPVTILETTAVPDIDPRAQVSENIVEISLPPEQIDADDCEETSSSLTNDHIRARKPDDPLGNVLVVDDKAKNCVFPGCKVRFEDPDVTFYHARCHTAFNFECPECNQRYVTWSKLASHLWQVHKIDMELYACDKCDYKTVSLGKLISVHKLIHSEVKAFPCDVCGKGFKNVKQLRNHTYAHRRKILSDSKLRCKECRKQCFDNRQLRVHIDSVHRKIKPFLCNICGYKGASKSSLKSHMRQHTGERPFVCDICDFTTSDHNSLRRHKLRHTGERPYKCIHCDYACIQSSTYKVHLKTKHPGLDKEHVFSCPECKFHTINKEIFECHMLTVHKNR